MKTHRFLPLVLTAAASACFSGCASVSMKFAPDTVPAVTKKIDAALAGVTVAVAPAAEKTGRVDLFMGYEKTVTAEWQAALEKTLARVALFSPEAARKLALRVTVREFMRPILGVEMHVKTAAVYEITEMAGGAVVFREEIAADGITSFGYTISGNDRRLEAENRAVQRSVTLFIERLAEKGLAPAP